MKSTPPPVLHSSRRRFLGGAAVTVGLPWLESLVRPRTARAAVAPKRFLAFFIPCGVHMPNWRLGAEGALGALSPTLAPLTRLKSKLLVLSGLQQGQLSGVGAHQHGPAGFLTSVKCDDTRLRAGVSMDQVLARAVGGATRIHSLQLAVSDGGDGTGNQAIYSRAISWAGETQPIIPTSKPDVAFNRMFDGASAGASAADRLRRAARRASVLDSVIADASALRGGLAATDRLKLDEYLSGVRDLERRLKLGAAPTPVSACASPQAPAVHSSIPEKTRIFLDLIVLGYQCDATRVITFMLGNGGFGSLAFPFLGIPENHHPISHHQGSPVAFEKLKKIDLWEAQQLAYLLEKLDAVQEGDRTLLDNSVVYYSSEISDGDRHNFDELPILLAGSAGGALKPGRHIRANGEPVGKLFVSLMNAVGAPTSTFGPRGTGPLSALG